MGECVWDVVSVDVPADGASHSFECQQESGSVLYQVDSIAEISPRGKVTKHPSVHVAASGESLCAAFDAQVSLFTEAGSKFTTTLTLDSAIDCVCWNSDGRFLVAGQSNGQINVIDATFSQQTVFSQSLTNRKGEIGKTFNNVMFTPENQEGSVDLLVLSSDSQLFRLGPIFLGELGKALEDGDLVSAKSLQEKINIETIDVSKIHKDSSTAVTAVSNRFKSSFITAGTGRTDVALWEASNEQSYVLRTNGRCSRQGHEVKQVKVTADGRYIFTLDNKGVLSMWSVDTFTILRQWSHMVQEFLILQASQGGENTRNSWSSVKVVTLTEGSESSCVQIYSLPQMALLYTLQLNLHTTLAQCPLNQEAIYVLEGVSDGDDHISSFKMFSLMESAPETRLKRILARQDYDTAIQFAEQYDLDIQLVHKAKCMYLVECLSPWTPHDFSCEEYSNLFEQLSYCLHAIPDNEFVVNICKQSVFRTFHTTQQALTYAKARLTKPDAVPVSSDMLTQILMSLHRLSTFQLAFGICQFSGSKWSYFLGTDLLEQFLKYLSQGHLTAALTIWKRHQAEFEARVTVDVVSHILRSIPEQMSSADIKPWLADDFIPYIIRVLPGALGHIARWLEQKARNMELFEKDNWPRNALEMSQLLHKTCVSISNCTSDRGMATPAEFATQVCNLSIGYTFTQDETARSTDEPFIRLQQLAVQLKDLLSLHTKYDCHLSLAEYVQETTESLTYRMLDRVVAVQLIDTAMKTIVLPYMREQRLNKEKVLFQYIGDLLERSARIQSCIGEASWEAKAIAVIDCINDPEYKCRAILDVMKRAYIPWSSDIEQLVAHGLKLNHSRVDEIREQCRLLELTKMLTKYNLRHYNVYESKSAESLLYYILSQDQETAMQDALQIAKSYTHLREEMAYVFRLRFLIKHNKLAEAMQLLQSLPDDQARHCASLLLTGIILLLDDPINMLIYDDKKVKQLKLQQTLAGCELCKILLKLTSDSDQQMELKTKLNNLSNMRTLQEEFGEFVSYSSYTSSTFRESLLKKHVQAFFQGKSLSTSSPVESERKVKKTSMRSYTKIFWLAEVLYVSRDHLRMELALIAAQLGQIESALRFCSELTRLSPETASTMYQVAHRLCQVLAQPANINKHQSVSAQIHQLACKALLHCSPALLPDCLDLCKVTSLASKVLRQCESGDYGQAVMPGVGAEEELTNRDPYLHWTFDKHFQEDGLVMDSSQALPLTYQYSTATIPAIENKQLPYCQDRLAGTPAKEKEEKAESEKQAEEPMLDIGEPLMKLTKATNNINKCLRENSLNELALQYCMATLQTYLLHHSCNHKHTSEAEKGKTTSEKGAMEKITSIGLKTLADLINTLLVKVCSHGFVDHGMALGYMCTLQKPAALERLKKVTVNSGYNYKRIMALSRIGSDYSDIINEKKIQVVCKEQEKNALWGAKLAKIKIQFKDAFNKGFHEKSKLLQQMVNSDAVSLTLLKDYCSAFQLDTDEAMLLYLNRLLIGQSGVRTLPISQIRKEVTQIIDHVINTDKLKTWLADLLGMLDPYDYDHVDVVLEKMTTLCPSPEVDKGVQLLNHLRTYKRVAPPGDYEKNYKPATEEEQLMYGSRPLSKLCNEKLPFHPFIFGEPWKIISPELNTDNVAVWIPVASVLQDQDNLCYALITFVLHYTPHSGDKALTQLSANTMYLTSIHNIVDKYLENKKKLSSQPVGGAGGDSGDEYRNQWNQEETARLFDKIRTLLMKVDNCEMAVTGATWVVKKLPMGPEKVLALKSCVVLAQKWMQAAPEKSVEGQKATATFRQFSSIFQRLSTEQILYQYRIAEPELLDLTQAPAKLLFTIFEHDSILKRPLSRSILDSHPDILRVADEIAAINKIDFTKVRRALIQKWLPSGSQGRPEDADMTLTFNFGVVDIDTSINEVEINQDEVNLKRVTYLLQQGSIQKSLTYLYQFAFTNTMNSITTMCRVRALRCLFALADIKTVEDLCNIKVDETRSLLQKLLYLSELEHLHIPHTLASFHSCNKERLVRGIWKDHNHEHRAVRLVADLCLDYQIFNVQLWNSVLQQLSAFNMMEYLRHVLVCLSGVPDLWQVASVQSVWKNVLHTSLAQAIPPLSTEGIRDCIHALSLLHRCPILQEMDLCGLAKHFERLSIPACTLACYTLITDDQSRYEKIEALLGKTTNPDAEHISITVLNQMQELHNNATPLPMEEQVKEEIYNYIDRYQLYEVIHQSEHTHDFVMYLIKMDALDQLAIFLITNKRISEVIQLVTFYTQFNPGFTETVPYTNLQLLKFFLNEKGLLESVWELLPEDDLDESSEEQPIFSKTLREFNITRADVTAWNFTEDD